MSRCVIYEPYLTPVLIVCNRIVVPVKKYLLSEDQLSQPIPTLSDRQFVVQKSKLSSSEAKAQRELFWYREELFKCVRGRWREVSSFEHLILRTL
jgi:hypothetical protein